MRYAEFRRHVWMLWCSWLALRQFGEVMAKDNPYGRNAG